MTRLPFDPKKVAKQDPPRRGRREQKRSDASASQAAGDALTVTQIALLIKDTLAEHTPRKVRVAGEVGDMSDRGHWFLSLKDEQNKIDCVMWKSAASKLAFKPERGMQLLATGRLDFYGPQGRIQLYLDKLEPVGQGALELKFRQLCEELRAAGYFDPAHKKPMPAFAQRIAVITSAGGAALQDVIRTARHRWAGIRLIVVDVRVQGAEAAGQIARAIAAVDREHAVRGIDAVILTRGGGSLEDLWAFNERVVADAVYHAEVPIAAGVGHEVDTTIAELVADLRCSTPTQAAERLVPDAQAERQRLDHHAHRLLRGLVRGAERGRQRVEALARHEFFRRPAVLAERARQRVSEIERRLHAGMARRHESAGATISALQRQLHAVSPHAVLERGYSYTTDADGKVMRSVGQVSAGDHIRTHLSDGQVDSTVDGEAGEGTRRPAPASESAGGSKPPQRGGRRRSKSAEDGEPRLFE